MRLNTEKEINCCLLKVKWSSKRDLQKKEQADNVKRSVNSTPVVILPLVTDKECKEKKFVFLDIGYKIENEEVTP